MAWIDVSKLGFLARRDLPLVPQPVLQDPLPVALLLPQAPQDVATIPTEGVASSRLLLEEKIDKFHFEEQQGPRIPVICISDAEGKLDRSFGVHNPYLILARLDDSD